MSADETMVPDEPREGDARAEEVLVRVCAGPHRGAEMVLRRERRYVVGSGDAADIAICDPAIEAEHLWLEIGDGAPRLFPLEPGVSLDGRVLAAGEGAELGPLGLVSLGETRFAVAARSRLPASLDAFPSGERDDTDPAAGRSAPRSRRRRRQYAYLATACAAFIAFVVLVFSHSPPPLERSSGSLLTRLEGAVADVPIGARALVELPDGTVLLEGYVASEARRRELTERVESFGPDVTLRVWSDEGLVDSANRLLASLGLGDRVAAVSSERGVLTVEGGVDRKSTWLKALSALHEDLDGVGEIRDADVATTARRAADVREALAESFPGAALSVATVDEKIVVSGAIAEHRASALTRLIERLSADFTGGPTLELQVSTERDGLPELNIRWVSLGAVPYVLTDAGDRYLQGGRLADGYVIKTIGPDRLILSRNGRETEYPL